MSLRRTLLTAVLASTALLSACSLRPRLSEVVVQPGANAASVAGQTVALQVLNAQTNRPVPGARVLAGDARTRMSGTTDADGIVKFDVPAELLKENPLVEVVLPAGVSSYRLQLMPSGQSPAPEAAPGTPQTPEAPTMPESPTTPESPTAPQTPPATPTPSAGT